MVMICPAAEGVTTPLRTSADLHDSQWQRSVRLGPDEDLREDELVPGRYAIEDAEAIRWRASRQA